MDNIIDLCGAWKMRWSDGLRGGDGTRFLTADADLNVALDVTVPGEVHEELIKNGLIPDTNLGLNYLAGRWVEETFWHYRRTFNAPKIRKKERAYLVFECLDLAAVIYLNGVEIGRHANYFYPCRLDVTEKLRGGENVLMVTLESGLFFTMDRSAGGYCIPMHSLTKRPWLRKTQSSFGWDWSPRLLNVGIPGDVYLEISQTVRFDRLVVLAGLSDDLKTGTVTGRVFAEGLEKESCRGRLELEIKETRQKVFAEIEIKPGLSYNEIRINVDKPNLWWPVNHGPQNRYTVRVTLSIGRRVIKTDFRKVGFRQVKIVQDTHPEGGNYFIIEINKKPIFTKGGNFVPADTIFSRIDRKRYEALIDRALEANFNFLRVWGGGLYEKDSFYDLCDEKGVLVWQEFNFACGKYPTTDEKFLADLKLEAAYQIRRLAHHPSLVVWCGNNEMEAENYDSQKGAAYPAYPDYAFFHLVLPLILKKEDPDRYYQASSPISPNHENPSSDDQGDQHPWSVGFFNTDFRDYRKMTCRFPDEGGILGPTSLATVKACLSKGMEKPGSFAWEIHDNSSSFWGDKSYPDLMLQQWLGKDIGSMSLEDYVYYAGIVQGEGLSEYIKNFRRRMFSSASAVFWMFNDCWPMVRSWTIVDYYLRRTPSFYPVRRAFAPLTVAVTRENDKVRVYGINEGKAWSGKVRYGLLALSGGYPYDRTQPVVLPANASTVIAEFEAGLWNKQKEKTLAAFAILLSGDNREVARDRMFLPFFKEMVWPKTKITVKQEGGKAIFQCQTFAWRVCLDLEGEKRLPDNFFDIFPGIPTILEWPAELGKPKVLRVGNL